MKRGLKAEPETPKPLEPWRYNRFPDEKGTESPSSHLRISVISLSSCYNRFPDEKGTESRADNRSHRSQSCYNRFPDEKGTERPHKAPGNITGVGVTTVSPMKRGLKDL